MEKNWVNIFTTNQIYLAEIIKDVLADNDMQAVIFNKQDSAYVTLGDIEIYVKAENVIKAKFLIKKLQN
ncbi:MAG: DUF2007 domain-containing protein [Bacteroidetes bacterium]|nr:DUF2007 domain-containing protein [Bacteroidota bacterium]